MFLSQWREFPSAPCLAGGKKTWWQLASTCCWNHARPWHASELVSFAVGLRTYQHPVASSCLSARLSVSMEQLGSADVGFSYVRISRNSTEKIQASLKSDNHKRHVTCKPTHIFYLTHFFLEWEIFQTKVVEEIKSHILCTKFLFQKPCSLWHNVEKYYKVRQATDDNMAYAHWMLDT